MKTKFNQIYQFKISLNDSKPDDYHLHDFEIIDPATDLKVNIGIPDKDDLFGRDVLPGWKQKIAEYFSMVNPSALYTYDFGDDWVHKIKLEKILLPEKNIDYPVCIKGKRACPPEDCGGIWEYKDLLEIINDPKHEEHEEMLEWLGGEFDPEHFDVKEVCFSDPDERLRDRIW